MSNNQLSNTSPTFTACTAALAVLLGARWSSEEAAFLEEGLLHCRGCCTAMTEISAAACANDHLCFAEKAACGSAKDGGGQGACNKGWSDLSAWMASNDSRRSKRDNAADPADIFEVMWERARYELCPRAQVLQTGCPEPGCIAPGLHLANRDSTSFDDAYRRGLVARRASSRPWACSPSPWSQLPARQWSSSWRHEAALGAAPVPPPSGTGMSLPASASRLTLQLWAPRAGEGGWRGRQFAEMSGRLLVNIYI